MSFVWERKERTRADTQPADAATAVSLRDFMVIGTILHAQNCLLLNKFGYPKHDAAAMGPLAEKG